MQKREKNMIAKTDKAAFEQGPAPGQHKIRPQKNDTGFFGSLRFRYGLILAAFLALGAYFLWQEHEAHIIGYLPLILVLVFCGGMHFFMHGAHGGHGGGHGEDKE